MSSPIDVDALTPEQIRQLIIQHDWYLKVIQGHPERMMVDVQAGILQQLTRLADTHTKLLETVEEMRELMRERNAMAREFVDEEKQP